MLSQEQRVEDGTWKMPTAEGTQSRNPRGETELREVGGNGEHIMGPVLAWAAITNIADQGAQTTDIYLSWSGGRDIQDQDTSRLSSW